MENGVVAKMSTSDAYQVIQEGQVRVNAVRSKLESLLTPSPATANLMRQSQESTITSGLIRRSLEQQRILETPLPPPPQPRTPPPPPPPPPLPSTFASSLSSPTITPIVVSNVHPPVPPSPTKPMKTFQYYGNTNTGSGLYNKLVCTLLIRRA